MSIAARDILYNFSVFIDDHGYIGMAREARVPVLSMRTEDFLGGGMSTPAPVHLGTDKLTAEIILNVKDGKAFDMFGVAPGNTFPFTLYGAIVDAKDSGGLIAKGRSVVIHMVGYIGRLDEGTWAPQRMSETRLELELHKYERIEDGETRLLIDAWNGIIEVGGVDQTAWMRQALALPGS